MKVELGLESWDAGSSLEHSGGKCGGRPCLKPQYVGGKAGELKANVDYRGLYLKK